VVGLKGLDKLINHLFFFFFFAPSILVYDDILSSLTAIILDYIYSTPSSTLGSLPIDYSFIREDSIIKGSSCFSVVGISFS